MPGFKDIARHMLLVLWETQDKPEVGGVFRQPLTRTSILIAFLQQASFGGTEIDSQSGLMFRISGSCRKCICGLLPINLNPMLVGLFLRREGTISTADREGYPIPAAAAQSMMDAAAASARNCCP